MPRANDTKNMFLEILLAPNIVHSKDTKLIESIPKLKLVQFIISNTQNFGIECLRNCLPPTKLSYFDSIIFTFEMRIM